MTDIRGQDETPFIVQRITNSALGPAYRVENVTGDSSSMFSSCDISGPPGLSILGPAVHRVVEGEELALVCRDQHGRARLAWRKQVGSRLLMLKYGPGI